MQDHDHDVDNDHYDIAGHDYDHGSDNHDDHFAVHYNHDRP